MRLRSFGSDRGGRKENNSFRRRNGGIIKRLWQCCQSAKRGIAKRFFIQSLEQALSRENAQRNFLRCHPQPQIEVSSGIRSYVEQPRIIEGFFLRTLLVRGLDAFARFHRLHGSVSIACYGAIKVAREGIIVEEVILCWAEEHEGDITCQELKLCVYYVSVYFSRRCQLVTRIPILATGAAGS